MTIPEFVDVLCSINPILLTVNSAGQIRLCDRCPIVKIANDYSGQSMSNLDVISAGRILGLTDQETLSLALAIDNKGDYNLRSQLMSVTERN